MIFPPYTHFCCVIFPLPAWLSLMLVIFISGATKRAPALILHIKVNLKQLLSVSDCAVVDSELLSIQEVIHFDQSDTRSSATEAFPLKRRQERRFGPLLHRPNLSQNIKAFLRSVQQYSDVTAMHQLTSAHELISAYMWAEVGSSPTRQVGK